jgi:hypothetical protein
MYGAIKESAAMHIGNARKRTWIWAHLAVAALLCAPSVSGAAKLACDPQNGGITLPGGFCAVVLADDLGGARHLAVAENGDVYVSMSRGKAAGPDGSLYIADSEKGRIWRVIHRAAGGAS